MTFVRKPTTMTCMVWDGANEEDIVRWLAKKTETGLTEAQINQHIFRVIPPSMSKDGKRTALLWTKKSAVSCEMNIGDAVVREPDGDGYYPVAASVLAEVYVAEGEGVFEGFVAYEQDVDYGNRVHVAISPNDWEAIGPENARVRIFPA